MFVQTEYAIEEAMYHTYMQYGEDSREYQSMVNERKKTASKLYIELFY